MRTVVICILSLFTISMALIAFSAQFGEGLGSFSQNLLLNLVAEILGVALGIGLGVVVAIALARQKFGKIAKDLMVLVARFRSDENISPEAARQCVVCAVGLLAENGFLEARTLGRKPAEVLCGVCSLPAKTQVNNGKTLCLYCRLPDGLWDESKFPRNSPKP